MAKSFTAASIANAFLSRGFNDGVGISPMKIQKLCYLLQGYNLVDYETPAVNEMFEAWPFGPVLPSLYHECKSYKKADITEYLKDYDYQTEEYCPVGLPDDDSVIANIDFVWSKFGKVDATVLSDWTHAEDGPWDIVTEGGKRILRNQDIPNDLIKKYFLENMYGAAA